MTSDEELLRKDRNMTCKECTHWSPRNAGEMAKHGMAPCALGPMWKYFGPDHTCSKHIQAEPEVVAKRKAWLARKPLRKSSK